MLCEIAYAANDLHLVALNIIVPGMAISRIMPL